MCCVQDCGFYRLQGIFSYRVLSAGRWGAVPTRVMLWCSIVVCERGEADDNILIPEANNLSCLIKGGQLLYHKKCRTRSLKFGVKCPQRCLKELLACISNFKVRWWAFWPAFFALLEPADGCRGQKKGNVKKTWCGWISALRLRILNLSCGSLQMHGVNKSSRVWK